MEPRAGLEEAIQYAYAIAFARPHESFVEHLLRVGGRLPIREAAMGTIEAPGGTGFGCQGVFAGEARLDQFGVAQSGRGPEIVWGYCIASQQIGDLAMSPEQRNDQ